MRPRLSSAHAFLLQQQGLLPLLLLSLQLHGYAVRCSFRTLAAHLDTAQPSLVMVATWCLGEAGGCRSAQRLPASVNVDCTLHHPFPHPHEPPPCRRVRGSVGRP